MVFFIDIVTIIVFSILVLFRASAALMCYTNKDKIDLRMAKKATTILFGYRKCVTHAQVLSPTHSHLNIKNERTQIRQSEKSEDGKTRNWYDITKSRKLDPTFRRGCYILFKAVIELTN